MFIKLYQLMLTPPDFQTFRRPCCRVPFRCFKARLCLGLQILCQIRACAQAFKSLETCREGGFHGTVIII